MPFKSKAQVKFMYATNPKVAAEMEDRTKNMKRLPEHVKMKTHMRDQRRGK